MAVIGAEVGKLPPNTPWPRHFSCGAESCVCFFPPVCDEAPWPGRDGHTAVVFDNYIYVFGGTCDAYSCFNDVWRSRDGAVWEEITSDAPWPEVTPEPRAVVTLRVQASR